MFGIRRSHGDVTDGIDRLVLEEDLVGEAVVLGLPEVAGPGGCVEGPGLLEGHGKIDETAALSGGADAPVAEGRELVFGEGLGLAAVGPLEAEGHDGQEERPDRRIV